MKEDKPLNLKRFQDSEIFKHMLLDITGNI
jgi:hypothetical protein